MEIEGKKQQKLPKKKKKKGTPDTYQKVYHAG